MLIPGVQLGADIRDRDLQDGFAQPLPLLSFKLCLSWEHRIVPAEAGLPVAGAWSVVEAMLQTWRFHG